MNSWKYSQLFGLQLGSQCISITPVHNIGMQVSSVERLKLDLPSMMTTGKYQDHRVHIIISIEIFHFTIKLSYWDTLLSVQQMFGHDFSDLVIFIDDAH